MDTNNQNSIKRISGSATTLDMTDINNQNPLNRITQNNYQSPIVDITSNKDLYRTDSMIYVENTIPKIK